MTTVWTRLACGWLAALAASLAAPAAAETLTYVPPACPAASAGPRSDADLLPCYAPAVTIQDSELAHNRIGTPELSRGWTGLDIRVNPERPVLYTELLHDSLAGRELLHLVYRMHFEKIPLRLSRYSFEAHRNAGLMVIVTLDRERLAPLFVTTVHTCGCYRALIPTTLVPDAQLPVGWPAALDVHGFSLPSRLPPPVPGMSRVLVTLESHRHRVSSLAIAPTRGLGGGSRAELALEPLDELRALRIPGEDGRASMFYASGPLRGHVRGAWNLFEGLTLGFVTLDPSVGMDKDFGDPARTGTSFYTMLRFWKHDVSRLDRFDVLLPELGFRIAPAAAESRP